MKIFSGQALIGIHSFNEAEVRFHVIDPIMKALGYPGGPEVFIALEEKLEYPYYHIGRMSKKKDLPLGFPDYRAGLKGRRGSFIVEAKAATVELSPKDVEQAHSYAAHAQVGANYFVLCNGKSVEIHETLSGPTADPIVRMPISEIESRFHEIENILSPASLLKNCEVHYDKKLRLADGLGSVAHIRSGEYSIDDWRYKIFLNDVDQTELMKQFVPGLAKMESEMEMLVHDLPLRISGGGAERSDEGRIIAEVEFLGATKNNKDAMTILGIERVVFESDEEFISVDYNNPTIFESTKDFSVAQGTKVPPLFGQAVPIDLDVAGNIIINVRMIKEGSRVVGDYICVADYFSTISGTGPMRVEFDFDGKFYLELADIP